MVEQIHTGVELVDDFVVSMFDLQQQRSSLLSATGGRGSLMALDDGIDRNLSDLIAY